jgi:hypothetical protein
MRILQIYEYIKIQGANAADHSYKPNLIAYKIQNTTKYAAKHL